MGQGVSRDQCLVTMVMLPEDTVEVVNKMERVSENSVKQTIEKYSDSPFFRSECHGH